MRQTGKTKAMVEGLPEAGSTVIVHSGTMNDYVRRMIIDLRGRHVSLATRVRTVTNQADALKLLGLRERVFVDHAFEEQAKPDLRALVRELVLGINFTHAVNTGRPLMLEAGEPAVVEQLRAQVSCLELRNGDIVVLRTATLLTLEAAKAAKASLNRLTDERGLRNIGLMILDPGAELTVLRPTVGIDLAAQDGSDKASAAPVERAA